jgi:hypothetical protein
MKVSILWKGALIGTLALPLAAFAQSTADSDTNTGTTNNPAGQTGTMNQGTQEQGAMQGTKEVTGTISKVKHNKVWLNAEDGTKLTLNTDSKTQVYKPTGTKEKISALKEGEQVRASYEMKSDKPHALRIDVMSGTTGTGMEKGGTTGQGGGNESSLQDGSRRHARSGLRLRARRVFAVVPCGDVDEPVASCRSDRKGVTDVRAPRRRRHGKHERLRNDACGRRDADGAGHSA